MILVIGGKASGKRAFAQSLGYLPEQMADAQLNECPVIYNVQQLVRHSPLSQEQLLEALTAKQVVICNEVGLGPVPLDETERAWRDAVGNLCQRLASRASVVVRLYAGIPQLLKGELPC